MALSWVISLISARKLEAFKSRRRLCMVNLNDVGISHATKSPATDTINKSLVNRDDLHHVRVADAQHAQAAGRVANITSPLKSLHHLYLPPEPDVPRLSLVSLQVRVN